MSWKKSSVKLFNFAYFRLLLKRHLWLMYVPVGVYFAFLFLFLVLGIDADGILLLLFPYALVCVPATALIMYQYHTKKGEIAHIFSVPMTRVENFITTFLAGLTLIIVPLLTLTFVSSIVTNFVYNERWIGMLRFLFSMGTLSLLYYTFSTLGCLLGGTTLTQLMMMAVIGFGPLMLYMLVYACVNYLAFGGVPTVMSEFWVTVLCPLISGFEMLNSGHWSYFWIHTLIWIFTFGLSIYLAKIRPIELSGQSVVFKKTQNFVLKPMFYLNIVYMVFGLCSFMVFRDATFGTKYYFKVFILLAGCGFIVALMMNTWFSKDVHSLFQTNQFIQATLLTLAACFFIFVPLWQKEKSRILEPKEQVELELCYSGFGGNSCYRVNSGYQSSQMSPAKLSEILHYIDDHRELFVKDCYVDYKEACMLNFRFLESGTNQMYYIYPENLDGHLSSLVNELYILSRNESLNDFEEYSYDYYQDIDGTIFEKNDYANAIRSTYGVLPTDFILSEEEKEIEVYDGYYSSFGKNFYEQYHASLNAKSFQEWQKILREKANVLITSDEWKKINQYLDSLKYESMDQFVMNQNLKSQYQNLVIYDMTLDEWAFNQVSEDYIEANVSLTARVKTDFEMNDLIFFEGSETGLNFDISLQKNNGQWQLQLLEMKGVEY